jgi:hypothetical protein
MALVVAMSFAVIAPHAVLGGIALGIDDFIALGLAVLMPLVITRYAHTGWTFPVIAIGCLWAGIFLHGVLLGFVSSYDILGRIAVPTEMWQYLKRMLFFFAAFAAAQHPLVRPFTIYRVVFIAVLATIVVGTAQIPENALSQALASLYARTEFQLAALVDQDLGYRRVYGVAGHPVAWGGFCTFAVSLALPWLLQSKRTRERRHRRWRVAAFVLAALALVNLLYCASRAAAAACVVVVLCAGYGEARYRGGGFAAIRRWLMLFLVLAGAAVWLVFDRLSLLFLRFFLLQQTSGGGRTQQISEGIDLLQSHGAWLSGVGNAVQRTYGVSFGVEVEPVYLLVNYGVFGAIARYALLAVIAWMALRLARERDTETSAIGMATALTVAGYVVFSGGYFFFQELYVGVTPWVLFGAAVGAYERAYGHVPGRETGNAARALRPLGA